MRHLEGSLGRLRARPDLVPPTLQLLAAWDGGYGDFFSALASAVGPRPTSLRRRVGAIRAHCPGSPLPTTLDGLAERLVGRRPLPEGAIGGIADDPAQPSVQSPAGNPDGRGVRTALGSDRSARRLAAPASLTGDDRR
jgi:hypothetical protein